MVRSGVVCLTDTHHTAPALAPFGTPLRHHSPRPLRMTPTEAIDERGKVYARLTVLHYEGPGAEGAEWLCQCECGREIVVRGAFLRSGKVKSCGRCRQRNPKRKTSWDSSNLVLAILNIGTPPCEVGFGCPHLNLCATKHLACNPFWQWANYGGKAKPDPSQRPNAAIYKRIFPNG